MSSSPCKVLTLLFLISRRPFLPLEGLVKPIHRGSKVKLAFPRLNIKSSPCSERTGSEVFPKRHNHTQGAGVSSRTRSMHETSKYITSRESTSTCTRKKKDVALRETFTKYGATTEIKELAGPTVTVRLASAVARLWPPGAPKYLKVDSGRTISASMEWTFRDINEFWRVRLKPSRAVYQQDTFS